MKNLWAPWRAEFILSDKKDKRCIFCKAIKDSQKNDEKNLLLLRGKLCFCIMNKYPYSAGHVMILPNAHKGDLHELSRDEMLELMTMTSKIKTILSREMKPEGFNLGANLGKVAGAGMVGHLHLHIVPRWNGDTNFMPVISDVKVISQSLNELFLKLRLAIDH